MWGRCGPIRSATASVDLGAYMGSDVCSDRREPGHIGPAKCTMTIVALTRKSRGNVCPGLRFTQCASIPVVVHLDESQNRDLGTAIGTWGAAEIHPHAARL